MNKIIIGLLVSCIASSSTFALKITQGKVLKHKEWTTGNITKATYTTKDNAFSADIKKIASEGNDITSSIFTFAGTNTLNGKAFEPAVATGYSSIIMTNASNETKTFLFTLETCVNLADGKQNCAIRQDTIDVEPNTSALNTQNPSIEYTFDKAGIYPLTVKAAAVELASSSSSMSKSLSEMNISE